MMHLLASAPPTDAQTARAPDDAAASLIMTPMPQLDGPPRSYAEVYGPDGELLLQLANEAAAAGETGFAQMLQTLDRRLRAGELDPPAGPSAAPRLVPYVYPVV